MSSYSGSASGYDYMVPVWKLAAINNKKPKVVNVRKLKKESDSRIQVNAL